MAPGLLAQANMMLDNNVLQQIANSTDGSGGGGDGRHHHHHHVDHGTGSFNSTASGGDGFNHAHHHLLQALAETSAQHRMGIIVTISFSILAALIVLYTIVRDAYRVPPGEVYSRAQKQTLANKLHPAEVIPAIVAVAIIIQNFVFLAVQAGGLDHFDTRGCRLTSELIWPTFFLAAFVILVYSFETAIRGLSKQPFRPRGKFTTPVCLFVVVLLLTGLFLTAFFFPSFDICPAALAWWTGHYAKIGIALGGSVIVTHLLTGGIITFQLMSTIDIDPDERIAASRVVYIMVVNTAIMGLVLPFWIQIALGQFPIEASEVADIGITLTGMVFAAMHLFSRANADRLAIRPKNMPWSPNRRIRLFGSSDLHNRAFISAPLLEPKHSQRSNASSTRQLSSLPNEPPPGYPSPTNRSPFFPHDYTVGSPTPLLSHSQAFERPLLPQPVQYASSTHTSNGYTTEAHPGTPVANPVHSRQPTEESILDGYAQFSPIQAPAPLFAGRHERQDSNATSGSIEIGLRLSRPITGMEAPTQGNAINSADLEKNLPPPPSQDEMFLQPAVMTPPVEEQRAAVAPALAPAAAPALAPAPAPAPVAAPVPTVAPALAPASPPKNVGIGALGQGPKGGLKAMAQHTQRTSPLANVMRADSPTVSPAMEKGDPFAGAERAPSTRSVQSESSIQKSPKNLAPPAINGLPRSPSPRAHPAPAAPAKSPQQPVTASSPRPSQASPKPVTQWANRSESLYSGPATPARDSPTEWPSWAAAPKDWPSGDQVDVPSPGERRWT